MLHPLIARLSTETAAFFLLFGFFVASVFVSGCIQTLTSAYRRYRFHCRQPLCHSLSPVTAFHSLTSASPAVALSFTSPSCRRCWLLSRFVVPSSTSRSFTSACCHHRRPATRSLQLLIANVDSLSQESYKSGYRPTRYLTLLAAVHCALKL